MAKVTNNVTVCTNNRCEPNSETAQISLYGHCIATPASIQVYNNLGKPGKEEPVRKFFYSIEILLILFKLVSKNKNIKITEIKQQNRTRVKG